MVEIEGGAVAEDDEDLLLNINGDHKARVAAFVADLMSEDTDEAEIPILAMRRPVIMAVAVEGETGGKVVKWRVILGQFF